LTTAPAPDLNITFYDRLQPHATAGVYTVTVTQELTRDGTRLDTAPNTLPVVQDGYAVVAARFALDPSTVHASYPPAGSSGRYTQVLPHLTFNRAVLPWERKLLGTRQDARPPWMALLVFAADEVVDDPAAIGEFSLRTVGELRNPRESVTTIGPLLYSDADDEIDDSAECRTIDVPAPVFSAVVPREAELFYLAHMRDVLTAPQRREDGEILTEGQYGVLAANRFPRTPGAYAVHLVSLEGYFGLLDPGSLPAGTERVRLCSLWSWSFTNDPEGSLDPAGLLTRLTAPSRDDRENLALRLRPTAPGRSTAAAPAPGAPGPGTSTAEAATPEAGYAEQQLHYGYTAVPFRTLSGEDTYAWYRGPFTPLSAPELPAPVHPGPHTSADHALVYDPEHGLFDVSYAAAWTLGRTIALADPDYSGEVNTARRALSNRAATLSALAADPSRALSDPEALPATRALRTLASDRFRGLVQALQAPLVPEQPRPRAARRARPGARALLAEPAARQSLTAVAEARTPGLAEWVKRLGLLRGVPFNHLVPDPRMLPPESLRAFRIDPQWIQALVEGATDVGAHTSADRELAPLLHAAATRTFTGEAPVAGLLVNSELVAAWPVFDLLATIAGRPVRELRRDHLSPSVLLVLWDEVPDQVSIREPGQGIHFGIRDDLRISLRHLTGGPDQLGHPVGRSFPTASDPDVFAAHLREGQGSREPDVLNLRGDNGLVPALAAAFGLDDLSPAQFALELVNAPLEQLLLPEPTTPGSRP